MQENLPAGPQTLAETLLDKAAKYLQQEPKSGTDKAEVEQTDANDPNIEKAEEEKKLADTATTWVTFESGSLFNGCK